MGNSYIIALVIITLALIYPIILNYQRSKIAGRFSLGIVIAVWIIFVPLINIQNSTNYQRIQSVYNDDYSLNSKEAENPYGHFEDGKTFVVNEKAYLGFTSLPEDCEKLVFEHEPWLMFSLGRTIYSLENLKDIEFKYDNCDYIVEDGAVYNKDKTTLYALLRGKNITDFTVPSSVTLIDAYAFADNKSIKSVYMSNSVTELGEYCFYQCDSLISIKLSNNIEIIPEDCFYGDRNLKEIGLPTSLKTVKQYGFASCGLVTLHFPSSMISVEKSGFEWNRELEVLELNNGLEAIGDSAFNSCNNLKKVVVPESVVYLGRRAFSIDDVELPSRFK